MSNLKFDNATPSKLVKVSATFAQTGSMYVKASKVLAVAAILSGYAVDEAVVKTGLSKSALTRPVAIVRNGDGDNADRSPAKVSAALHTLFSDHGVALLGDDSDARTDAVIEAASVWDDFLSDQTESKKSERDANAAPTVEEIAKFAKRLRTGDVAILVHDVITAHADNADVWTAAFEDAIATVAASLEAAA